jgi:N-acetylmuramoyl-L-alanine amidase
MLRRASLFLLFILSGIILLSFVPKKNNQKAIKTIIVDAGHGIMDNGGHNGAKGSYSYEDDICLAVSKELIARLKEEMPEVRIVETRPAERIVALHRRAEIANQSKGDLFICIHANAMPPIRHSELIGYKKVTSYVGKGKKRRKLTKKVPQYHYWTTPNTTTKGAETYIWGAHKNEDKEVAMRENAPMMEEENFKENYGDIDPNSPEFIALSLLKTKQYFKRSATLAGFVQDEFAKVGRVDREVRQRQVGIWVLQATAMPSVLVETGYITNPSEEDYLNSKEGQKEIAICITNAVKTYIAWLERQAGANNDNAKNNGNPVLNDTKSFLNMVETKEKNVKPKM